MTNILSRAPGDAEEAEGDMDVVEEAATSGNATSAKKTRGRKTGTNDFPSKHFASTVPTVDAVFVRPRLTEYLDPKKPSTTNEDMLAAFFGCANVLDVRAAIESRLVHRSSSHPPTKPFSTTSSCFWKRCPNTFVPIFVNRLG